MFCIALLATFVYSGSYCIEKISNKCQELCTDLPEDVKIVNYFPNSSEAYDSTTIYFTEDVEINLPISNKINPIYCVPNITFTINATYIRIDSHNVDSLLTDDDLNLNYFDHEKIVLKFNQNFTFNLYNLYNFKDYHIYIEATEDNIFMDQMIILDDNYYFTWPDWKYFNVTITENSKPINVFEINNKTRTFFTNVDKLIEIEKTYYCISDKQNKCSNYSPLNPTNIKSPSQINSDLFVLIVDSNQPVIYTIPNLYYYTRMKIIIEEGSQLLLRVESFHKPLQDPYDIIYNKEFFVILQDYRIDMTKITVEGNGTFVLKPFLISFANNALTNYNDFSLMGRLPEFENENILYRVRFDTHPENKVKLLDHFVYTAESTFEKTFTERVYINYHGHLGHLPRFADNESYYMYDFVGCIYVFKAGDHYVPSIWKYKCSFYSDDRFTSPNSTLHLDNAHSYDNSVVDDIILLDHFVMVELNTSKLFEFSRKSIDNNVTFNVKDEIFMHVRENEEVNDENIKESCEFVGTGTINIDSKEGLDELKSSCQIDEKITLNIVSDDKIPDFNLCIGGTDLEDCLNKIDDSQKVNDDKVEWIWSTSYFYYKNLTNHIKKIFFVDNYTIREDYYNNTEKIVTSTGYIKIFASELFISEHKVNGYSFSSESSKITVFPMYFWDNITINHESSPKFDLDLYVYNDMKFFFNNVTGTLAANSIKVNGWGYVYYYEDDKPYLTLLDAANTIFLEETNEIIPYDYAYYCVCDNEASCKKCKGYFRGNVTMTSEVDYDIESKFIIRIFIDNFVLLSRNFTYFHDVYVDPDCHLIVPDMEDCYKFEKDRNYIGLLNIISFENVILKPKSNQILFVFNHEDYKKPEMTIEVNGFLKLGIHYQVTGYENTEYWSLNFKGNGYVSIFDYPFDKLKNIENVQIIKGYQLISKSYEINFPENNFKFLNRHDNFDFEFDENSVILVDLYSFDNNLDVDVSKFNNHRLFINSFDIDESSKLLNYGGKLRILSTSVLTNKADNTNILEGENGKGAVSLSNMQADSFIVGFNDKLTIKQDEGVSPSLNTVIVQPQSKKATIVFDENINLDNKLIQITSENEKIQVTVLVGEEKIIGSQLDQIIDIAEEDRDKVTIENEGGNNPGGEGDGNNPGNPEKDPKGNGFPTGAIIGIVVGVVVLIAIVVVVVIVIKKKKKTNSASEELSEA